MNQKYGTDYVATIGTAQNFKLKSSFKDLLKLKGVDFITANKLTSFFSKEYDFATIDGLFELCTKEPKLKKIINEYPDLIYQIYLCIFQPRSFGVHAAGVIVVPEEDNQGNKTQIYDYVPTRFSKGQLVTEWEKDAIEGSGLLKEDILGLRQLDKIMRIKELIAIDNDFVPDFNDISLEEEKVFKLFQQGVTEDIFQFNTPLQKQYCIELKPTTIDDLIASNAILRPGAMENGTHYDYIKLKNGVLKVYYPPRLEEILKDTFGRFIYQEQAMLSFQVATDCDLNEADNFRKVITKLKPGKVNPDIDKYEKIFKEAYIKMASEEDVDKVWGMIIGFATYGFNKCIHKDSKIEYYCNLEKLKTARDTIENLYKRYLKGEEIYVKSYVNGKFQQVKIKEVFKTGKKQLLKLSLENNSNILSSEDHKFLTLNGWKILKVLNIGEELLTDENIYSKVISIEKDVIDETYDIEVENKEHNYVANGIVVHNSHAACYAITGYWACWYKAFYPVEFYTAALEFADDESIGNIINEIQSQNLVTLSHPDINKSDLKYEIDKVTKTIYWSLTSVKFAGAVAIDSILCDRKENGDYFSFEEFLDRSKNFKANKRVILNMILSGCFDQLEKIVEEKERLSLVKYYLIDYLVEKTLDERFLHKDINKNYYWVLLQKSICNLGNINYSQIYKSQKVLHWISTQFLDYEFLQDDFNLTKHVVVAGVLENVAEKLTKKDKIFCQLQVNSNNHIIKVTLWEEQYLLYKQLLLDNMFKPILVSGTVSKFRNENTILSNKDTKITCI
jgi:DNA polymerase III alpha subunit